MERRTRSGGGAWRAALIFVLAAAGAAGALEPPAADLVLTEGRVWTGDPGAPEAQAVAVLGDRVVWAGRSERADAWIAADTRVVRLRGRRVVPGIVDSHVHFIDGGAELLAPDLRSAASEQEFARRLGAAAAELPEGTWLTSGSWDHESWAGARLPTRQTLDRFVPRHPVFVQRLDGHMAVANSLALRLAGVDRSTRAPPGGEIVRESGSGEPTGVLKDAAMGLVSRHVPAPDGAALRRRALAALAHAAQLGVTGVHHMGATPRDLKVYQQLLAEGRLIVRIVLYPAIERLADWEAVGVRRGFGSARLRVNGLKGFADGSLGSTTAYFFEPYVDAPTTSGLTLEDLAPGGRMEQRVRGTVGAGLQPAIHAIGDRAIREMLDIFARLETGGARHARCRVEHSQHVHPDDIARFAALGVIASMQPYHAIDDGRWAEKRIGARRCETTYAFRSLLDSGASVAFGSDWPVAPLSPWAGIYAAVTRRTLDEKNPRGWIPQQRISVEEALRAYTSGSAHASFDEGRLGRLRPGYLADLVVLADDVLKIPPAAIRDVRVDLTVVGGEVVYERR